MSVKRIILYVALCLWLPATAQFNHSFSTTTTPYVPLQGTSLFSGEFDEDEKWVSLEFSFSFNNQSYDSILVHTDGMASFTSDFSQAIAPFQIDLASTGAGEIRYTSSPTVLKIEYANCGVSDGDPSDAINVQLWIHSNGTLEFHYGTIQILDPDDAFEHQAGALIGLIDLTGNNGGKLVTGTASSPTATSVTGLNKVCIAGTPAINTVYRFQ